MGSIINHDRFRRAIINICDNACQAMMEHDKAKQNGRTLTVHTQNTEDFLEIIIMDTGPGISSNKSGHILEPLYSTKSFGIGLGLPIVKEIVEQHQGEFKITREEGNGTKVIFRLPINTLRSPDGRDP